MGVSRAPSGSAALSAPAAEALRAAPRRRRPSDCTGSRFTASGGSTSTGAGLGVQDQGCRRRRRRRAQRWRFGGGPPQAMAAVVASAQAGPGPPPASGAPAAAQAAAPPHQAAPQALARDWAFKMRAAGGGGAVFPAPPPSVDVAQAPASPTMRRRSSAIPAGAAAVGALRRPTGAGGADGHTHRLWRPDGGEEHLQALEAMAAVVASAQAGPGPPPAGGAPAAAQAAAPPHQVAPQALARDWAFKMRAAGGGGAVFPAPPPSVDVAQAPASPTMRRSVAAA
ncbi:hypothetical protein CHLRE_09g398549v5 [Chlamydomonas reinhardtii]|uniref:Uncharacterized protein n=1 Tax=Chlamydomonas reinhardtii TaxID=3055 RepID=A0A2K3DES8_CHLRE|nr:uncharacterized protein CHLRE_09g398549v5 [Chlamydomonas reinhardtii]PNW79038.1 hypothetical protein CHLRE_09g398549v5 [Chlamydomonas reinhardtii]